MPRLAPVIKTVFLAMFITFSCPLDVDLSSRMLGAAALRPVEPSVALDHAALSVQVSRPRPIGERSVGAVLVPPLRHDVEDPVDAEELLAAAGEGRVGVEHVPGVVLEEDTVAREVRHPRVAVAVVVERAPGGHLLRLE